jgi:hypothetical protein
MFSNVEQKWLSLGHYHKSFLSTKAFRAGLTFILNLLKKFEHFLFIPHESFFDDIVYGRAEKLEVKGHWLEIPDLTRLR